MDFSPKEDTFEDKLIKFDVSDVQKKKINGELLLAKMSNIEDRNGNPGDYGCLLFTNLRIVWYSLTQKKHNLAVGLGTVSAMNKGTAYDKVRGTSNVLQVHAHYAGSRFEFLFIDTLSVSIIFDNATEFHRLYQRNYLYRELKLHGAIHQGGKLILLPQEQIYSTYHGVMNLSSDQGNLGIFVITNIRLVWCADANENFNLSLSHRQITHICVRMSKYGQTLVISTSEVSGGYILGFRIDPVARLLKTERELSALHKAYILQPEFGMNYNVDMLQISTSNGSENNTFRISEFSEIDDKQEENVNSKIYKYLKGSILIKKHDTLTNAPVYCSNLGFAAELTDTNCDLEDLWNIYMEK